MIGQLQAVGGAQRRTVVITWSVLSSYSGIPIISAEKSNLDLVGFPAVAEMLPHWHQLGVHRRGTDQLMLDSQPALSVGSVCLFRTIFIQAISNTSLEYDRISQVVVYCLGNRSIGWDYHLICPRSSIQNCRKCRPTNLTNTDPSESYALRFGATICVHT